MATRTRRRGLRRPSDTTTQRRKRYQAVLRQLGLYELFAAMPRGAQEAFSQRKFPDPILEFDASIPTDQTHRRLCKEIESNFRDAFIHIDDGRITIRDFFSVFVGLKFTVEHTLPNRQDLPEPCLRFMREAGPLLDYWYTQHLNDTFSPLHKAIIVPLVRHTRLDTRLLTATCRSEPTAIGKSLVRIRVAAREPEVRRARIDGTLRPVYRVRTTHDWNGGEPVSWDASLLGRGGTERYPVYVQSHALRQLRDRVDLPAVAPYAESWLTEALKNPRIVEAPRQKGPDLLVEYRINDHRIGYLVVTPTPDLVLVRTFLFLTMEPSPEAESLRRQLRLSRHDINWLGLHQLSAFTHTDLRTDPVLRPLLEKCGCGHLFALAEDHCFVSLPKPMAGEVKKFLRMAA